MSWLSGYTTNTKPQNDSDNSSSWLSKYDSGALKTLNTPPSESAFNQTQTTMGIGSEFKEKQGFLSKVFSGVKNIFSPKQEEPEEEVGILDRKINRHIEEATFKINEELSDPIPDTLRVKELGVSKQRLEQSLGESTWEKLLIAGEYGAKRTARLVVEVPRLFKSMADGIASLFEASHEAEKTHIQESENIINRVFEEQNIPEDQRQALMEKYSPKYQKGITDDKSFEERRQEGLKRYKEGIVPFQQTAEKWIDENEIENPTFVEMVGQGYMSMIAFWMASSLTGGGSAMPTLLESLGEAGTVYEESKDQGRDPTEAFQNASVTFVANLIWNGLLNKWSGIFDKVDDIDLTPAMKDSIIKIIKKHLIRGGKGTVFEGLQEGGQQVISNIETGRPVWEGVWMSTLVGAVVGGTTAVATGGKVTTPTQVTKTTQAEEQLTEVERKQLTDAKRETDLKDFDTNPVVAHLPQVEGNPYVKLTHEQALILKDELGMIEGATVETAEQAMHISRESAFEGIEPVSFVELASKSDIAKRAFEKAGILDKAGKKPIETPAKPVEAVEVVEGEVGVDIKETPLKFQSGDEKGELSGDIDYKVTVDGILKGSIFFSKSTDRYQVRSKSILGEFKPKFFKTFVGARNFIVRSKEKFIPIGEVDLSTGKRKAKLKAKPKKVVRERPKRSTDDAIKEVEEELAKEVEDRVGEVAPKIGLGTREVYKPPLVDKVSEDITFSNKEAEERYKKASGVNTQNKYLEKARGFVTNFYHRFTRTYPDLPNTPRFAELRNILSLQKSVKEVTQDRTARIIQGITADMGSKKLDLFTRKVILDDLTQEAKSDRALPLGYSTYNAKGDLVTDTTRLKADMEKIDRALFNHPDVVEALKRRGKIWKAVTGDLVTYNILTENQLKENYFRHQILEHVNAKSRLTKGVGKRLKAKRSGFTRHRGGSTYDINTDYLQAEFEVMSQALHDIETAKLLNRIERLPINIKSKLVKEAKGTDVEDWHDLIPEGYTTWQPRDGRVFYSTYTVPERIVNAFVDNIGTGVLKIDSELVKKATAVGGMRKEFVLPEEASTTLDNLLTTKPTNIIRDTTKVGSTLWKQAVLFGPRRSIKYNFQNFLGDADAVFAGNPSIFKKFPQATRELYAVYAENAPMTAPMKDFFTRGGFSSTFSVQEIPDVKSIVVFERFYNASKKKSLIQKANIFKKYWEGVKKWTQFRESLLRYSAYLDYIERFTGKGKPNYGSSNRADVNALSSPKDKASKVATELLGDYANITAFGKDMRESVAPFYSWIEINFKRYPGITKNAWQDGYKEGSTTSARTLGVIGRNALGVWATTKVILRIISMTSAVLTYNQLFFKEEEDDLSEYDKGRMHFHLGRDKDGDVKIMRGQGAFSDLIEWFGLGQAPIMWREYFDGKASLTDILGTIPLVTGQVGLKPFVQKMMGSISPFYKAPAEFMSGFSWPYQGSKSYPIADKWRQLLRNVQLENEYDFIFQKPSRGYLKSWGYAVVTTTDPLENSYRYIQSEKYRYLEIKGKGGSGNYYTPRSIHYRNYKKALAFGDKKAEDRAWNELAKLGVTYKDLEQSIKWTDPLAGLNKAEKKEFVEEYLSTKDVRKLVESYKYYEKVFLKK